MRRSQRGRGYTRAPRFESIEPRVVLSAPGHPAAELVLDPAVEQPFSDELFPSLIDAQPSTGLAEVRRQYSFTGQGQTVAIIDSGIAYGHTALGGGFGPEYRVVGGYDFTGAGDADPYDEGPYGSHGTHVAGIIGSTDAYYPGVAPGVDLVALRVFDDAGRGRFAWVEEALRWVHENRDAFENPITTVTLSVGKSYNDLAPPPDASLEDELATLEADGMFIAVAAGNRFTTFNAPGLSYPAASGHVVPVSSVDDSGRLSYFTQRHPQTIAAPGRGVMSTVPDYVGDRNGVDDDFARYSGTSMAAPYVAAASVLLREAYQFVGITDVTQTMLYDLMYDTADVIHDDVTGLDYRRLNVSEAIGQIIPADGFGFTPGESYRRGTLTVDGRTVRVSGTEGDDRFTFTAGSTQELTINGVSYRFADTAISSIVFDGLAGSDTATLNGTMRSDTATIRVGSADLRGPGYQVQITNVQNVTINGAGGDDLAILYDSPNDDTFVATYTEASLTGASFSHRVTDFETVQAYATSGGHDTADLFDSPQNDTFVATPRFGKIFADGFFRRAKFFDAVHAYATEGGNDVARLYGSAGKDVFVATPSYGKLSGDGYLQRAKFFQQVTAWAGSRGADKAIFYDSQGDDVFTAFPTRATLRGESFTRRAQHFGVIYAFASAGGHDVAHLYDSSGADTFFSTGSDVRIFGPGFYNRTKSFEEVHAHAAGGGKDRAYLYDTVLDDHFQAAGDSGKLSSSSLAVWFDGFDYVRVLAARGGSDTAQRQAVDYVLDLLGNWES